VQRTALTLEYDGAGYYGFQRQIKQKSVQSELERVLAVILRQKVRVFCAGRTDTGVNALGQVVHFNGEPPENLSRLIYALNSLLPKDIAVRHAARVPADFHARFSCLGREYVYLINNHPYRPGTLGLKALWVRDKLQWDLVRAAIPHLLGERDFAAFTKVRIVKEGEVTIRRIDAIDIVQDDLFTYIYFRGSGFLHNMIRILVGTLIDVARGNIEPAKVGEIIASTSRLAAGVTMRPDGLYFLHAEYKDYDQSEAQHGLRKMLLAKIQ
jgi:tRNA pseudouridine38-40 synthase